MAPLALTACVPLVLILLGCLGGWPGWQTGVVALIVTVALAHLAFRAPLIVVNQATSAALVTTFSTLGIVVPALFLSALLQVSGSIEALVNRLASAPRALLVLFLTLGVSTLLEAVCGFGTGIVICVPLYLALGYSPQQAALLGIVGESTGAYASMGNALTLQASLTGLASPALGSATALFVLPFTVGCALVAVLLAGGATALRHWGPVALGAAALLVGGEWLGSKVGVSLAGLLASLLLCVALGGLLWGVRRTRAPAHRKRLTWRVRALIGVPFLILVGGQLLLRDLPWVQPLVGRSTLILADQHLVLAWHPGLFLLLASLSVVLLLWNTPGALSHAWRRTARRALPLATMITAFFVLSSIMQASGMLTAFATLFPSLPGVYVLCAPVLGLLGGWTTGSTTASNALLAVTQQTLATRSHLSALWLEAVQSASGSFGRLLAPSCLFLVTNASKEREPAFWGFACWLAVVGLVGSDGVLAIIVCHTLWMALVTFGGCGLFLLQGLLWFGTQELEGGTRSMERFALLGAGSGVFRHHRAALEALPGHIVALVDTELAVASLRAQELGCPLYTDYQQMLEDIRPDVAVILTPSFLHASMVCVCLEAGCHVLCEKPLALSVAEAEQVIETARRCQRQVGVVFQQRYRPEIQMARRLLEEGALGQLQHLQVFAPCPRPDAYYRAVPWRGTWWGEGGGVLMNQAPHVLDLIALLVGMPDRVYAVTRRILHKDIETEDSVQAQLEWSQGILGSLCVSTALSSGSPEAESATMTLTGTSGSLHIASGSLDYLRLTKDVRQFARERMQPFPLGQCQSVPLPPGQGDHLAVYQDFLRALQEENPVMLDGTDARPSLELANALLVSGYFQSPVTVPVDPQRYQHFLQTVQAGGTPDDDLFAVREAALF